MKTINLSCFLVCFGSVISFPVNQHTCLYTKEKLMCIYNGDEDYRSDRRINEVEVVEFDRFDDGKLVLFPSHFVNLDSVIIKKTKKKWEDVCEKVDVEEDVEIIIQGKSCRKLPTTTSTTAAGATITTTSRKLSATISIENTSYKTESQNKPTLVSLIVTVAVLTMILLVVSVMLVRSRRELKKRQHIHSRISFSERRIRRLRGEQFENEDTPV